MNEFKKFVKNEDDNWEEYKDLINEDTKFMMRDENGTEIEMTPREVINQLYQDNKTLENYIYNLQSKIDKAIEYIEKKILNNKIEKVDWDFDDCYYSDMPVSRIKPLIDILKEDK